IPHPAGLPAAHRARAHGLGAGVAAPGPESAAKTVAGGGFVCPWRRQRAGRKSVTPPLPDRPASRQSAAEIVGLSRKPAIRRGRLSDCPASWQSAGVSGTVSGAVGWQLADDGHRKLSLTPSHTRTPITANTPARLSGVRDMFLVGGVGRLR